MSLSWSSFPVRLHVVGPLLFLFSAALLPAVSFAADPPKPPSGPRIKAFSGENTDGWIVTTCQVTAEKGVLSAKDGNGFIRTAATYRDFVLELSYKPGRKEKYDSGIYIRSALPSAGKPWPDKHQVNLKQGDECNLIGFPAARSKGLVKEGDWNQLKLTVVGGHVECEINGQKAWSADGLTPESGYIGIQVEAPGGGPFEFRDIYITELGYRPLFNGMDLTGWEGGGDEASNCWTVDGGDLVCTGKPGPWLRSTESVKDFNLRLEYLLKEAGNSGVYVRVDKDGKHHNANEGVEVQILDDNSPKYAKLKPGQFAGSVYQIAPASPRVGLPPGHWNTLEIDVKGERYRVIHNGTLVVDASPDKVPGLAKHRLEGFLGLQNHNEEVRFRHIRVGPPLGGE